MLLTNLLQTQAIPADSLKEPAAVIDQTIKTIIQTPVDQLISTGLDYGLKFGIKILAAVLIYIIGAWLIRKIKSIIRKICEKRSLDASLTTFLLSFTGISLSILLIVTTISVLGVDTTSFVALLAGSGVAIGMALSGTLQNFSGGIMILVFKPFKVGDYIEAQGYSGTVTSIEITATHINTPDNKKIILPNGALSNGTINNYSTTGLRRCDWNVSVPYGTDLEKAKEVGLSLIRKHKAVVNDPAAPHVYLTSFEAGYVVLSFRSWVKVDDYWDIFFEINEEIYKEFPKNGLNAPVPKMDITVKNA